MLRLRRHLAVLALAGCALLSGCASSDTPSSTPLADPTESQIAKPRDWGTIDGKAFRPGIPVQGGTCTTNFLFQENWTRFFLGTAAHCFTTNPEGAAGFCQATDWNELGSTVPLNGRDGTTMQATIAYNSAAAMTTLGETDAGACGNNDFLLLELDPGLLEDTHPAVLYFGGPTALTDGSLQQGDDLYFFGNSGIRDVDYLVDLPTESEALGNHEGEFYGYILDGWDFTWAFGYQPALAGDVGNVRPTAFPMPGDSGGPFLGPTGHALAMLGGGANNLAFALAWMEAHWPWAPELVTWQEFSPDGIEPLKPV